MMNCNGTAQVVNRILPTEGVEVKNIPLCFLRTLNHEFRTQLNGVLGLASLLSQKPLTRLEQKEYGDDIGYCGNRLKQILEELLKLFDAHEKTARTKKLKIPSQKPSTPKKNKKACVLLVEDNKIAMKANKLMLEKLGYNVDVAENGAVAVEKSDEKYLCILMDIRMPVMDGLEATRKIRQKEKRLTHIPIIGLTAEGKEIKKDCLAAGMDDFMLKPASLPQLQTVLGRFSA